MKRLSIQNKIFSISIPANEIQIKIGQIADQINRDLEGKDVVFVVILNGAFMFASDLYKQIKFNSRITFLKLASYSGVVSTGNVRQLIGLNESLEKKTVVIIEDIIDTGRTLDNIIRQLKGFEPNEIKICALLHKPDAFLFDYKIDYLGFCIPNDFIIGYGLDFEGFGRNLDSIYTIVKD